MAQVARAPGDGYTMLLSSSSVTVNPSLYNKMPYDVEKDFIPVTKAGGSPNSWLVNPSFPAKTMKELVDLIKKEPGKYSVALARRRHHAVAVDRACSSTISGSISSRCRSPAAGR